MGTLERWRTSVLDGLGVRGGLYHAHGTFDAGTDGLIAGSPGWLVVRMVGAATLQFQFQHRGEPGVSFQQISAA